MLKKLLKYDCKALGRMHIPLYGVLIALAVFVRAMMWLGGKYPALNSIQGLSIFTFCILIAGSILGTFVMAAMYFYQNLVKDEGYLTHTLPVKTSSLIASKTISAFLFTTVTFIVCMIALVIAFYQPGMLHTIENLLVAFADMYNLSGWIIVSGSLITYLLGNLAQILLMYLALALGQLYTGKKLIYSIVYMIALYTGIQIITSIVLFGAMGMVPGLWNEMNNEIPSLLFIGITFGVANILNIVLSTVFYYGTTYVFKNKLNMD